MLKFFLRYFYRFVTSSSYRSYVLQLLKERAVPANGSAASSLTKHNDFSDLRGCKAFLCGGCELTFIGDYLKHLGLDVYHTFENGRTSDPFVEVNDPDSELYRMSPDFVVFCQTQAFMALIKKAQTDSAKYPEEERIGDLETLLIQLSMAVEKANSLTDLPIFLVSHFFIGTKYRGTHEYKSHPQLTSYEEINLSYLLRLYQLAKKYKNVYVLDVNEILELEGKRTTLDGEMRSGHFDHPTKLGSRLLAEKALYQFKILNPKGKRIKCAVFDLDNTLWKGVLREDGPSHLYPKWAHLQALEALAARGILLAVCSKNDPEDEVHLEQILGGNVYDKLVSIKLNWGPKSQNIKRIASELNLGMDALAFFDDNPVEREEVKANAPGVLVFDESDILEVYEMAVFEPIGLVTEEAAARAQMYKEQAKRAAAESSFNGLNLGDFYKTCQFQLQIKRPEAASVTRMEELIQRTNQLNATGVRTTCSELEQFLKDHNHYFVSVATLRDKFGDYGLIGVCIAKKKEPRWQIVELDFSCRAMGKHVEHAVLAHLCRNMRENGGDQIAIHFKKSSRNKELRNILQEFGFSPVQEDEECVELSLIVDKDKYDYPEWFEIIV